MLSGTRRTVSRATATARRAAWHIGTRRLGKGVLSKTMNYYRLNANDKRNFLTAYNKYLNALNNTNRTRARHNAQVAATQLTNTLFKVYNKKTSNKGSPVAEGIQNGVQRSLIYWLPGVIYRRTFRLPARRASA